MIFENKHNEMPVFKIQKPIIEISGRAIPEDAKIAWYPFIDELQNISKLWNKLEISFKFDFFNTSSIYFITRVFYILDEMRVNSNIKVNWYYIQNDEDMQTSGEEYVEMFPKLTINLISRK